MGARFLTRLYLIRVCRAIVSLASSRARIINGTNIEIDGGIIVSVAIGVDWDKYHAAKKEAARRKAGR